MTTPWYDEVKARAQVPAVAAELGLDAMASHTWGPCPACDEKRRSPSNDSSDKRGAVGVREDRLGWHCYRCDRTGSAVDLVAFKLTGDRSIKGDAGATVRSWFAQRGWCSPSLADDAPRVAPRQTPPHAEPPTKPRPEGLQRWWESLVRVDHDLDVAAYLRSRNLDPEVVADRDLARAVPSGSRRPVWAYPDPFRLVVPMFDATGALVSARIRRIADADGPKSKAPRGCSAGGVVFACGIGRHLLGSGDLPEWWPSERRLEALIVEGEIDHLAVAAEVSDESPYAVLGIAAGSWTPEIAARIPNGITVTIATDPDDEGDKYASKVADTLTGRVKLFRWESARSAA